MNKEQNENLNKEQLENMNPEQLEKIKLIREIQMLGKKKKNNNKFISFLPIVITGLIGIGTIAFAYFAFTNDSDSVCLEFVKEYEDDKKENPNVNLDYKEALLKKICECDYFCDYYCPVQGALSVKMNIKKDSIKTNNEESIAIKKKHKETENNLKDIDNEKVKEEVEKLRYENEVIIPKNAEISDKILIESFQNNDKIVEEESKDIKTLIDNIDDPELKAKVESDTKAIEKYENYQKSTAELEEQFRYKSKKPEFEKQYWVKQGYYIDTKSDGNSLKIYLNKLNSQKSICNLLLKDSSGNTRRFELSEENKIFEYEDDNNRYTFIFSNIGPAGKNPFKKALYFTFQRYNLNK